MDALKEDRAKKTSNLRKRRYGGIAYTRHGEGRGISRKIFLWHNLKNSGCVYLHFSYCLFSMYSTNVSL